MSHQEALRRIEQAAAARAPLLDLSGCDLAAFPEELRALTWLEELRVDGSEEWGKGEYASERGRIEEIPPWIAELEGLRVLKVRGQRLRGWPDELIQLDQLTRLYLSGNQLMLSPKIKYPVHLTCLDISYNELVELPPEFFILTQLTSLDFRLERGEWLIPDLLPKEEPDTGDWAGALHFVYRYPVLPGSIIARFIVRSQHAIEGELRWRNGVVLRSEGNRAQVKADPEDSRIDIRVSGEQAGRRRFLSAIRYTFEQIHKSLSALHAEIDELVPLPDSQVLYSYSNLLRLEARGKTEYYIPDVDADISIPALLDGYETGLERQARRVEKYDEADPEHLAALVQIKRRRLSELEQQLAHYGGLHVPVHIPIEIADLRKEIEQLRGAVERRGGRGAF